VRYICEIDVALENEGLGEQWYCGRCDWQESKKSSHGGSFPYCNVFAEKLKLDKMLYELPAVLRCRKCRLAFYPAGGDE
jgi:hypothetical protein